MVGTLSETANMQDSSAAQGRSGFLALPPELRNMVYEHVRAYKIQVDLATQDPSDSLALKVDLQCIPALRATCRQIREEFPTPTWPPTVILLAPMFQPSLPGADRRKIKQNMVSPFVTLNLTPRRLRVEIFLGRVGHDQISQLSYDLLTNSWFNMVKAHGKWMSQGGVRLWFEIVCKDGRVAKYEFAMNGKENIIEKLAKGTFANGTHPAEEPELAGILLQDLILMWPEYLGW